MYGLEFVGAASKSVQCYQHVLPNVSRLCLYHLFGCDEGDVFAALRLSGLLLAMLSAEPFPRM